MDNEAPLIGEGLALDLVNTRAQGAAGPIDHIGTTADLAAWLVLEAQHFSRPDAAVLVALDDAGLAAVHRVRDSAAQLISALRRGDQAPEHALRALNRAAAAAPAVSEIAQDDDGTMRRSRRRQGPIGVRTRREARGGSDVAGDPRRLRIPEGMCGGPLRDALHPEKRQTHLVLARHLRQSGEGIALLPPERARSEGSLTACTNW